MHEKLDMVAAAKARRKKSQKTNDELRGEFGFQCCGIDGTPIFKHGLLALGLLVPDELHLLLRIFHKEYAHLVGTIGADGKRTKEGNLTAAQLPANQDALKRHGIARSDYHGNPFEGNAVRNILNALPQMNLCPSEQAKAYYRVLEGLREVKDACFGTSRQSQMNAVKSTPTDFSSA